MRIKLTVLSGPLKGLTQTFDPVPARIQIGRGRNQDYVLRNEGQIDRGVSREHCILEISGATCLIRDNDSRNRVRLNGARVRCGEVHSGDRVRLSSNTEIQVEIQYTQSDDDLNAATVDYPTWLKEFEDDFEIIPWGPCLVCTHPRPLNGTVCPECRSLKTQEPQSIPGYLLLRLIGHGGMGKVWLAEHRESNQLVAIKGIQPDRVISPVQISRFVNEAKYLNELKHPNIIQGAVGFTRLRRDSLLYFVMEYIPGVDSAALLKERGPLSINLAVRITRDVLQGLAYAHERQMIHRDIKPANVMVVESPWRVVLADFGLAYHVQESQVTRLTQSGDVGGTLAFMAPEQGWDMTRATFASDQFSTAATLYTLLSGRTIRRSLSNIVEELDAVRTQPILPIRRWRPTVPASLEAILQRALEVDPAQRFPNVQALANALLPYE